METVLVLVSRIRSFRLDNFGIIPSALMRAGFKVLIGDAETLAIRSGRVVCSCLKIDREYHVGDAFPELSPAKMIVDEVDLVWSLASPHPGMYLEFFQLLWVLNSRVPFVNDAASLLFLNNKITLSASIPEGMLPDSYVSSDYNELLELIEGDSSKAWIIKPGNEGCGADVFRVQGGADNCRALLQSATGNEVAQIERYGRDVIGLTRRYAAVQEFVPNVVDNEKRVLLVGGEAVCGFRRYHHADDHRANVTLGNKFTGLELDDEETAAMKRLATGLMMRGIYYAGVDLAYPYVLELNLVNPGALNYSYKATGIDQSDEAVAILIAALRRNGRLPSTPAIAASN